MIIDTHVHSEFSFDSEAPVREILDTAIRKGVDLLCLTEHMDYDLLCPDGTAQIFDPKAYFTCVEQLKEEYAKKIKLLIGVEFGMMPHLAAHAEKLFASYPFDYVIGSQHAVLGGDPYYPAFFEGKHDTEVFRAYFDEMLENLNIISNIDSLGHLDYIVRYGNENAAEYSYERFSKQIDAILDLIIQKEIALEVNSAGIRKIGFTNPHPDVLLRYRKLGGTLITYGSDAHTPELVGDHFSDIAKLLSDLGFSELTYFEGRQPKHLTLLT